MYNIMIFNLSKFHKKIPMFWPGLPDFYSALAPNLPWPCNNYSLTYYTYKALFIKPIAAYSFFIKPIKPPIVSAIFTHRQNILSSHNDEDNSYQE
jgi:hypothetical protein